MRLLRRHPRLQRRAEQQLLHQPAGAVMWSKLSILVVATGCASSIAPDPGLEGLALTKVAPDTIVPGTKIVVAGASFVDSQWGDATLHLSGGGIDVHWPATFVDFGTMTVAVDAGKLADVGGDAQLHGTARIEVVATSDGQTYTT